MNWYFPDSMCSSKEAKLSTRATSACHDVWSQTQVRMENWWRTLVPKLEIYAHSDLVYSPGKSVGTSLWESGALHLVRNGFRNFAQMFLWHINSTVAIEFYVEKNWEPWHPSQKLGFIFSCGSQTPKVMWGLAANLNPNLIQGFVWWQFQKHYFKLGSAVDEASSNICSDLVYSRRERVS